MSTPSPNSTTPSSNPVTPSPSTTPSSNPVTPSPSTTPSSNPVTPSPSTTPSPATPSSNPATPSPYSISPSPTKVPVLAPSPSDVWISPSPMNKFSPSPSILTDSGQIIPTIAVCLFFLMIFIVTVFRKKTRKMWERYNLHRYRHVDGEYHAGLPSDLPVIDDISHYPTEEGIELGNTENKEGDNSI